MCDKELLVAYLYDDIIDMDRARVERHLRECAACRAEAIALRTVRDDLGGVGCAAADDGVPAGVGSQAVMARVVDAGVRPRGRCGAAACRRISDCTRRGARTVPTVLLCEPAGIARRRSSAKSKSSRSRTAGEHCGSAVQPRRGNLVTISQRSGARVRPCARRLRGRCQ